MPEPSEELVQRMRRETGPRTLLSFSRGKDSVAAYLAIRDHFEEVIPYYCQNLPCLLSFEKECLDYFEKEVFKRHIYRFVHPSTYMQLGNLMYQPPDRVKWIRACGLDNMANADFAEEFKRTGDMVREKEGCPDAYVASGVRAADSPHRRRAMMMHGAVTASKMQYYPCWDWNKERVIREIDRSGIVLPVDYRLFGRSLDGKDLRFMAPLKRHYPEDYRKVLEWFPLADMDLWLLEKRGGKI